MKPLSLATETLIATYFSVALSNKIPTELTKKLDRNIFVNKLINANSPKLSLSALNKIIKRNLINHELNNNVIINYDITFSKPLVQIEYPISELTKSSVVGLTDPLWSSFEDKQILDWVDKYNGHVGDYSSIIIPTYNFLKKLSLLQGEAYEYELKTKKLNKISLSEIKLKSNKPIVYVVNEKTFGYSLILPKMSKIWESNANEINHFMSDFFTLGERVFEPVEENSKLVTLNKYWNTISNMLPLEVAEQLEYLSQTTTINSSDPIKLIPVDLDFIEILDLNKELIVKNISITKCNNSLEQLKNDIHFLENKILEYENSIKKIIKNKENSESSTNILQLQKEKILEEVLPLSDIVNKKISTLQVPEAKEYKFLENYKLEELNIIFEDGDIAYLYENWQTTLRNKLLNRVGIHSIHILIYTEKPSIISVDKAEKNISETTKVLGGPYQIDIDYRENKLVGYIKPKDFSSIVGLSPVSGNIVNIKAHPHSQCVAAKKEAESIAYAYKTRTKICFGELEMNIKSAIARGDLAILFGAIDAWVTSAWSKDQWGAEFNWFPPYKE